MIHVLNGDKAVGAIGVIYPEGSTCTCANADGTKTYTAKTTTGQWLFSVPTAGEWMLACTDGTDSVSKKVTVTEDELTTEKLSYPTYIVKGGVFQSGYSLMQALASSWGDTTVAATFTQNEGYFSASIANVYISPAFDVTNYSKVALDIMPTSIISDTSLLVGIATGRYNDDNTWVKNGNILKKYAGTRITVELDTSSITGNVYLKMARTSSLTESDDVDFYNVYLCE